MTIVRTDSDSPDFQLLAAELEHHLRALDGDLQEYYAQLNRIGPIAQVLVAYKEGHPIGCGAIREYEEGKAEIKRMYVRPAGRGQGIATRLLDELEQWAREAGYTASRKSYNDQLSFGLGLPLPVTIRSRRLEPT